MEEIWKDVKEYEGLYQVSNTGKIKSLKRQFKKRKCIEKIISPSLAGKGYYRVHLSKNGIRKYYYIHKLVANAFIPNITNKPTIDHIDRNKLNNNVNNLRWATYLEQRHNRTDSI